AERIRRAVESTRFEYSKDDGSILVPVTISLGVASLQSGMHQPTDLIEAADRYLYKSKQGGRNRVSSQAFDS
ncbi:MAG: diguanylate cyclase, partial [Myxococcota bacterium]